MVKRYDLSAEEQAVLRSLLDTIRVLQDRLQGALAFAVASKHINLQTHRFDEAQMAFVPVPPPPEKTD